VVFDSHLSVCLSLSDHVATVCRSSYYQLRQLRLVVWCLLEGAAKTMVKEFVVSHLDYCNTLCYGITDELTHCLQSERYRQARDGHLRSASCTGFLCGSASCPPVLVRQRPGVPVVHRSLSGNAPVYWLTTVRSSLTPVSDNCVLPTLVVSRTRSSFGNRTFAAAGPQVWNSLPHNLRLCGLSYGQFRRLLKIFLFRQSSSSRMLRVMTHNWSATKQRLHPQSVAEINHHSVLSGDRIRQCGTSSGSCHKDTDQCL